MSMLVGTTDLSPPPEQRLNARDPEWRTRIAIYWRYHKTAIVFDIELRKDMGKGPATKQELLLIDECEYALALRRVV